MNKTIIYVYFRFPLTCYTPLYTSKSRCYSYTRLQFLNNLRTHNFKVVLHIYFLNVIVSLNKNMRSVKFKITPVLPFQRIVLFLKITGRVLFKRKSGWHWYCDTIIITSYTFWLWRQTQTIVNRPLPLIETTDKISSQHKCYTAIEFIDEGRLKIGEVNAKTNCNHFDKTSPVINVVHKFVDSVKGEEGKQAQDIG